MDARSAEGTARSFGLVSDSSLSWFVNGVPTSAVEAKQIIADSIATVEVNKVEGRSRISIVTKSATHVGFATVPDTFRALRRRVGRLDDTLAFTLRSQPAELQGAQPILLIDDVRADMSALKKIDRARIATVNVLKGVSAVSLYGPDAKNGVIVRADEASGRAVGAVQFPKNPGSRTGIATSRASPGTSRSSSANGTHRPEGFSRTSRSLKQPRRSFRMGKP